MFFSNGNKWHVYYKRTVKCEQIKWRNNIGWTIGMLGLYRGTSGFASNALEGT